MALAAALVLHVVGIGVAASSASAFQGQSTVINPETGRLTGPAKTIITNPTFLPNEPTVAPPGSATQQSPKGLLRRAMQGSKLIPVLGRVLPWVGGAVVAYEVCNAAIQEGCFLFSQTEEEPAPSGDWKTLLRAPGEVSVCNQASECNTYTVPFAHYWTDLTIFTAAPGTHEHCGVGLAPPTPDQWLESPSENCFAHGETHVDEAVRARGIRAEHTARAVTATTDTGVENYAGSGYCPDGVVSGAQCSSEHDPEWDAIFASQLETGSSSMTEAEGNELGEHIAAQIEGSGVEDPYVFKVSVPECSGEAWIGCKETLEELELVPERVELDWQTAVIEQPPDTVVETQPAPGTKVETGTKVTVTTNPDEAGMPLVIPEPLPEETYADYIARLAPGLNPERITVAPDFADPAAGPNGVIRTSPEAGSRANPQTETEVQVYTNPADTPVPNPVAWAPPAVPSIELSPLSGVAIGCNDFPFGIFCWLGDGLTSWGSSGTCPDVGVPLGSSIGLEDEELPFDLCQFEPAMEIIRPILVLVAALSMAYLFAAAAMGFGGGTGDD